MLYRKLNINLMKLLDKSTNNVGKNLIIFIFGFPILIRLFFKHKK